MIAVVTGSRGFIGQHLVAALDRKGFIVYPWSMISSSTPYAYQEALIRPPDFVFHLATTRVDADGFKNAELLRQVDQAFPNARIINISTIQSRSLASMYAVSKRAAELYAAMRVYQGRDIRTLRLANVYGPGQLPPAVIPAFIEGILTKQLLTVTESEARDFIYIRDVVEGILAAAFAESTPHMMDLATGVETLVDQLPNELVALLGSVSVNCVYVESKPSYWDNRADISVMSNRCKWMAQTSLHEGLKETIAWHKSRLSMMESTSSGSCSPETKTGSSAPPYVQH